MSSSPNWTRKDSATARLMRPHRWAPSRTFASSRCQSAGTQTVSPDANPSKSRFVCGVDSSSKIQGPTAEQSKTKLTGDHRRGVRQRTPLQGNSHDESRAALQAPLREGQRGARSEKPTSPSPGGDVQRVSPGGHHPRRASSAATTLAMICCPAALKWTASPRRLDGGMSFARSV